MQQEPKPAPDKAETAGPRSEFRLYRRLLLVLYIATWVGFGGLALVSVVYELFLDGPDEVSSNAPDLLRCNQRVGDLLDDLEKQSAAIQKAAPTSKQGNLSAQWEQHAKKWHDDWREINRQCRFKELADTGLGPAYDRMAWVHLSLPTAHLKYSAMLKRFAREQSDDLRQMTAALTRSRELLQKKEIQ